MFDMHFFPGFVQSKLVDRNIQYAYILYNVKCTTSYILTVKWFLVRNIQIIKPI